MNVPRYAPLLLLLAAAADAQQTGRPLRVVLDESGVESRYGKPS